MKIFEHECSFKTFAAEKFSVPVTTQSSRAHDIPSHPPQRVERKISGTIAWRHCLTQAGRDLDRRLQRPRLLRQTMSR
jgi:hypothetical protein